MARRKLTDEEFVALIEERASKALPGSKINELREKALEYYFGEQFGDEVPGRSKVVMREVYGVIEWIMPALMRVFFGGEDVVWFTPKSGEDVAAAEQETAYVNHVIMDRNDGFMVVAEWFKDALLSSNSYVNAYYEKKEDTTVSRYEGLDPQALDRLLSDPSTEIVGQEIDDAGRLIISVRTATGVSGVCLETIPAERVKIDGAHKKVSLRDCRFVEYWEKLSISELREMGFKVDDDISDEGEPTEGEEINATREENIRDLRHDDGDADPASRVVTVHNTFIRADYDGDGIAELRMVVRVGKTILHNDYYDIVTLACITPTLVPHRHVGMSYAEVVMDLQRIKSALMRGLLDNLNLANAGRWFLDEDRVDWDDFLAQRPGGGVRVQGGVANAAAPIQTPVLGSPVIQALEYTDMVLENRTGASPRVLQGQAFDGNAINQTATGITAVMTMAMSRIEMIARMFAGGFSDLCRIVHALTLKHERAPQVFELRGEYVTVDPTTWERRDAMSIDTGLGTGNRNERVSALQMLATAQQGLMQSGIATPQTLYNTLARLTRVMGYKDVGSFWVNPASDPSIGQRANQPDPEMMREQAQMQAQTQVEMAKVQARLKDIESRREQVEMEQETQKAIALMDAIAKLQSTAMSEDNKMIAAGYDVQTGPRTRKVLHHVRGADGRISHSELVEIPEDESQP